MPWFKVDDGFHSSRKVLSIPRGIRLQAIGLWTLAGTWAMKELTDGHVPQYVVESLGGSPRMVAALVKSGLWKEVPEGTDFHDWDQYQPSKASVLEAREKEAERKRQSRAGGKRPESVRPDNSRTPDGQNAESEHPVPSRPDPIDQDIYKSGHLSRPPSYPQGLTNDQPEVDLGKVKLAVQTHCGRLCSDALALMIVGTVLTRSKVNAKNKTAFVLRAIENDPFEWQQMIDEAVA